MTPTQETAQRAVLSLAHDDFNKSLNSYAYFKVSSHTTGEDLVQETFIKTWKYLVKGGKIDSMKSFLYRVLNNLIVDEYRRRKTSASSLDTLLDAGYDPGSDESDRMFNMLDGKSALLLIARLPLIYQRIVRMKYMQGLSFKEMSVITGQSPNAMSVQLHRGVSKLRILYNHA
ncbi:MAG: RNA polymerase sigma factor [Candidatus Paceibacterota bacterium]|jgi:RNA polymerase sigma-70 factor (ECF subfamily)